MGLANLPLPLWEYARTGNMYFAGCNVVASGIGVVADFPTTTAALCLYNNNEASAGRCLVVDMVNFFDGAGTPAAGAELVGCVTPTPVLDSARPTANTSGYVVQNAMAGRPDASGAFLATAITIPTALWFGMGGNLQLAAANLGQGQAGFSTLLIVPPKHAAGFAVITGAGTSPKYSVSMRFTSIPLDLSQQL